MIATVGAQVPFGAHHSSPRRSNSACCSSVCSTQRQRSLGVSADSKSSENSMTSASDGDPLGSALLNTTGTGAPHSLGAALDPRRKVSSKKVCSNWLYSCTASRKLSAASSAVVASSPAREGSLGSRRRLGGMVRTGSRPSAPSRSLLLRQEALKPPGTRWDALGRPVCTHGVRTIVLVSMKPLRMGPTHDPRVGARWGEHTVALGALQGVLCMVSWGCV